MKNPVKFYIAASILLVGGISKAQNSASATAHVNADVVCPITLLNQSNLYFGTVIGGTGTAHVTAAGTETYTGNINAGSHSGTHAPSKFLVTGESGFTYAVTRLPASGTLTVTDGSGHTATVQLDAPVAAAGTLGSLTSCGTRTNNCNSGDDNHNGNDDNNGDHNGNDNNNSNHNGNDNNNDNHNGDDNHEGDHEDDNNGGSGGGCCGTQTFNVGGVLTVTAGQVPGDYSNANAGGTVWFEIVTYN